MEIKQAIIEGVKELKKNNIEDSHTIARTLMCYLLKKPKQYLIVNDREILKEDKLKLYNESIYRIKKGYPLQYITNNQEFMKLDFYVNEDVLIPQPDTEILVEKAIKICNNNYKGKQIKILDLCTGSGAIAISIKKYVDNIEMIATDISSNALKVAKINAEVNNVKVKFIESDMFKEIDGKFDIIVSNPPYIEKATLETLPNDVKCEPKIALDGGIDGLDFYKEISKKASKYLNERGYLLLEIGYNQSRSVVDILKKESKYTDIKVIKDLAGKDRVVTAILS